MRKWLPVMVGLGLLMGGGAYWFHSRPYNSSQLVQMLPPDRSVHVYLDVALLRSAGLLDLIAGSKSLEDADYQKFVAETGFDYRTDLNGLAIAFRDGDVYYAAQGKFNWEKIAAYAPAHGGKCERFLCTTPGSEKGRDVSYYMPRNNILALATSRTATAGDMVAPGSWENGPRVPDVGLWVAAPPFAFTDLKKLPDGTRSFVSPLASAVGTVFTLGAASGGKDGFELRMEVTTKDAAAATKLKDQYAEVTSLLVKMLEREKIQANPSDMSGLLVGGKFEAKESMVVGTWPVSKGFVQGLVANAGVVEKK
ncbi:MAG: hypothetical protein ABIR70_13375 [Bryobacteraceae bacterium]